MAIYANEDGTISDLTGEYLAADSGLTGIRAFKTSVLNNSLNTTVDFPSAPKFCMCFYRYTMPSSSGVTSDGVDRLRIEISSASSGNFVGISNSNGSTGQYRYTYSYNDSTKKLSVKISNGSDSTMYGSSSYEYKAGMLIIFY